MGAAETVRERADSAFYLAKDTFDAVAVATFSVAELEAVATTRSLKRCRTTDENHGDVDGVVTVKFADGLRHVREELRNRFVGVARPWLTPDFFRIAGTSSLFPTHRRHVG